MNRRTNLLRLASMVAVPTAALVSPHPIHAADDTGTAFLGAWNTVHTLPFPPGEFREFLTIGAGGVVHETNSYLNTASNLDFSMYGLPRVLNAADGFGNWTSSGTGSIKVTFYKMLFDELRRNFGTLRAAGTLTQDGSTIFGDWNVEVIMGSTVVPLGPATSRGGRIA